MYHDSYVDYYKDLQVSSNADLETIERIYRLLAKRYHPDNRASGDIEKFNTITTAYKVLSDAEKRSAFDIKYEKAQNQKIKTLSKLSSSEGFKSDQLIRHSILSILYIDRRQNPLNSGVGAWRLEQLLGWPEKILDFHIWYLKEKGWIQITDSGAYAVTVTGVEMIEDNDLILGKDRLLTNQSKSYESSRTSENIQSKIIDILKVIEKGSQ